MDHLFLLTYSVRAQYPHIEADVDKADKVRNDIAKLDAYNWEKLNDVETTFKGSMYLHQGTTTGKRKGAETQVNDMFIPILKDRESGSLDVVINCAIMVDGLGEAITFDVVNK